MIQRKKGINITKYRLIIDRTLMQI